MKSIGYVSEGKMIKVTCQMDNAYFPFKLSILAGRVSEGCYFRRGERRRGRPAVKALQASGVMAAIFSASRVRNSGSGCRAEISVAVTWRL